MKDGNEATAAFIRALDRSGIHHFLTGSFSSNYYGIPRSTHDADFVAVLQDRSLRDLDRELGDAFEIDPQVMFEGVTGTRRHMVSVAGLPFSIELFYLSDDDHDRARFRRKVIVHDATLQCDVAIPSAEDVIITKLRWVLYAGRGKDRDDVRDIAAVQGDQLDWDYIYEWSDRHATRELLDGIRRSIPSL